MTLRFLTAGESHGRALVGILEGMPSGVQISSAEIHAQLTRRKLGFGRGARQKIETDEVEILSGVRGGVTLGSPISLLIWNRDWENWKEIMSVEPGARDEILDRQVEVPRPGHADLIGGIKYAHTDMRNVLERASARETAMRVALGSIARKLLNDLGIGIFSRVVSIGNQTDGDPVNIPWSDVNALTDLSPVRCLSRVAEEKMIQEIQATAIEGDTLGGVFEVCAYGAPVGLGSYAHWDRRLEGEISQAFMSLNAIKGVEVGLGFHAAQLKGSQVHDEIGASGNKVRYQTQRSGGIEGGMTNGQPLVVRAAMKPLSTLLKPLQSVRLSDWSSQQAHVERSDVCAVPAAAVIGESLLALVLAKVVLEKFGGDSLGELRSRVELWNETVSIEK